jgi:glycosyltransferase involved in cell wall biosynthesis
MKIGLFCTFFPEKPPFTETKSFGYGGADESLFDLITEFQKIGHEITIFSIGDDKKTQYESPSDNLELYRFPVLNIPLIHIPLAYRALFSLKFLRIKKQFNFDVIHAKLGNSPAEWAALCYKKRYGTPMILDIGTVQNSRWGSFFRRLIMTINKRIFYTKILKDSDAILIRSKEYLNDDLSLKLYKNKIHIIQPGLDYNFFSQCDDLNLINLPDDFDLKTLKNENKKIILFVGSLVESKGIHILIKALKKSSYTHEDLVLIIAGQGAMQNELESLVEDLELDEKVFFVGYLDKYTLRILYHNADLFVLPSMSEGFPRVLLESMAAGTPCLVSDIGAHIGALENGKVGFIAKCFDVDDFSDKINMFFDHDKSWIEKEREKSKIFAQNFSWMRMAKEIEKIYREFLPKNVVEKINVIK